MATNQFPTDVPLVDDGRGSPSAGVFDPVSSPRERRAMCRAAIVGAFLFGTILPAAYGLLHGIHEPGFGGGDEFSYLLAADTFAHGRLTNPAPRYPEFFEAAHVLVQPTYNSKYPPAQGLVLAAGQVISGSPIWGVWLGCGCFAASLCWMLLAWTSKPAAIGFTCVAVVTLGMSSYWAQSYWGGMVAACGGSLVFGGFRRIFLTPRVVPSLFMGLGVLLLANTRPFEGALLCLPVAALLLWWLLRDRLVPLPAKLRWWGVPFGIVLVSGVVAMAVYNQAVTGSWQKLPYAVYHNQYFRQSVFVFHSRHEPERHPVPRVAKVLSQSENEVAPREGIAIVAKVVQNFRRRLPDTFLSAFGVLSVNRDASARVGLAGVVLWLLMLGLAWRSDRRILLCLGGLFAVALAAIFARPWVAHFIVWPLALTLPFLRDRWIWFCLLTVLFVVLGSSFTRWWYPHYTAPVVPVVLVALAALFGRKEFATRLSRQTALIGTTAIGLFVSSSFAYGYLQRRPVVDFQPVAKGDRNAELSTKSELSRGDLKRYLERQPGSHLVFVHYDDDYPALKEWVYNGADLETARVVFAHDLGVGKNTDLVAAYPGRTIWIASFSLRATSLKPYHGGTRIAAPERHHAANGPKFARSTVSRKLSAG